jgi:hypothetical protein
MTQMMIHLGRVRCPACDIQLQVEQEQDRRVAIMRHGSFGTVISNQCPLSNKLFRVDRVSGYSEEVTHAQKPAEVPLSSPRLPPARAQRQGEDRDPSEAS